MAAEWFLHLMMRRVCVCQIVAEIAIWSFYSQHILELRKSHPFVYPDGSRIARGLFASFLIVTVNCILCSINMEKVQFTINERSVFPVI